MIRVAAILAMCLVLGPAHTHALQRLVPQPRTPDPFAIGLDRRGASGTRLEEGGPGAVQSLLLSAVLPGAGQLRQGKRRWLLFAAVEAVGWILYTDRLSEGRDLRNEYRTVAWETARGRVGDRVVDDFEYYERLASWTSSGSWDTMHEMPGLQPETDESTYNGMVWARARGLFFGPDPGTVGPEDPEWMAAVEYYRERAYPPQLLWNWSDSGAQERFSDLIVRSDDRLGEATTLLAGIAANHLVAAADAFVTARIRERTEGRIAPRLSWSPSGPYGYGPRDVGRASPFPGRVTLRIEVRR